MSRANDLGSQYPSDSNDSAPSNPADNRAQSNYSIRRAMTAKKLLRKLIPEAAEETEIRFVRVITHGNDSLTCRDEIGVITVYKPWKLRRTPFDGETIADYSYSYSAAYVRTVTNTNNDYEVQIIVPQYTLKYDYIYALKLKDGTWLDMNIDARAWARSYGS